VLPARTLLTDAVTAGSSTIGLRWPQAEFALRLLSARDQPLTATSANRTGMASPISAEEVRQQFGESLSILVDGGILPSRRASTLLDITTDTPVLLREGPISLETLREFLGGRIRMN
jgi:L-threonylcarbamoyladenylate synthase